MEEDETLRIFLARASKEESNREEQETYAHPCVVQEGRRWKVRM